MILVVSYIAMPDEGVRLIIDTILKHIDDIFGWLTSIDCLIFEMILCY